MGLLYRNESGCGLLINIKTRIYVVGVCFKWHILTRILHDNFRPWNNTRIIFQNFERPLSTRSADFTSVLRLCPDMRTGCGNETNFAELKRLDLIRSFKVSHPEVLFCCYTRPLSIRSWSVAKQTIIRLNRCWETYQNMIVFIIATFECFNWIGRTKFSQTKITQNN